VLFSYVHCRQWAGSWGELTTEHNQPHDRIVRRRAPVSGHGPSNAGHPLGSLAGNQRLCSISRATRA
jgi:hypothetical protein